MQLNVSKKQREMVLLEESLHAMRSRFNSRFMSLRSIKREILATVAADNRRLREIDAELGGSGDGGGAFWRRFALNSQSLFIYRSLSGHRRYIIAQVYAALETRLITCFSCKQNIIHSVYY